MNKTVASDAPRGKHVQCMQKSAHKQWPRFITGIFTLKEEQTTAPKAFLGGKGNVFLLHS